MRLESLTDLPAAPVAALEKAAFALGRLEVLLESSAQSIAEAFPVRKAVALTGNGAVGAVACLLRDSNVQHRTLRQLHDALRAAPTTPLATDALNDSLAAAGASMPDIVRSRIAEAASLELNLPAIVRAAAAYGAIVSSAPATRETLCSAALAADLLLAAGGIATHSRVSPVQLDAATRSAAVQIERSGAWSEWVRAWSTHLAREATSAERAVRAFVERNQYDVGVARSQHRVGATDVQVLVHLQGVSTFNIPDAVPVLGLSGPTIGTSVERLETAGVATELTGQKRDRVWTSSALLDFIVGR
jgi:hypothetical protein